MLSLESRRLCEILTTIYKFIVCFYNHQGTLLFTIPALSQEYLDIYEQTGIYGKIAATGQCHPQVLSGEISELWSGFPVQYQNGEDGLMVVGPVFRSEISTKALRELMDSSAMSAGMRQIFLRHQHELPIVTYTNFINIIRELYYVLTGNHFDIGLFGVATRAEVKTLAQSAALEQKRMLFDETMVHATYSYEKYLLSCITEGNPAKLTRHLNNGMTGKEGILTKGEPLRQIKNLFIVSTTLATRAAVEGGLNAEVAFFMSDLFIQQVEQMQDVERVQAYFSEMLFEFTHRVQESGGSGRFSKAVSDCCQYIHEHIYQNIRVTDVAEHVHLSVNYLSVKFKEETGETIGSYCKLAKINEAKSLLLHSSYSLPEISALLSYSSQSFFSAVFKQETGVTPGHYRRHGQPKDEV